MIYKSFSFVLCFASVLFSPYRCRSDTDTDAVPILIPMPFRYWYRHCTDSHIDTESGVTPSTVGAALPNLFHPLFFILMRYILSLQIKYFFLEYKNGKERREKEKERKNKESKRKKEKERRRQKEKRERRCLSSRSIVAFWVFCLQARVDFFFIWILIWAMKLFLRFLFLAPVILFSSEMPKSS